MTKKELRKKLLLEKRENLLNLQLSKEYLEGRIKLGETTRQQILSQVKDGIAETKKLIAFFKEDEKA